MTSNLKNMRLSPLLAAVVALTTPLSLALPAIGQTKNVSAVGKEPLPNTPVFTELAQPEQNQENVVVEAVPVTAAGVAAPEVVMPTSTLLNAAKPKQATPTPKPSDVPDIPPPDIQPVPNNTNPPVENQDTVPVPNNTNPPVENQDAVPVAPNNTNPPAPGTETPVTPNTQPSTPAAETEARVLVAEILVRAASGQLTKELEDQIFRVIRTQAGRTTTRSQLQEDINAIFATGFFSDVQVEPTDTPLGVQISFIVQPNPVLKKVQIEANAGTNVPSVLPTTVVDEIFKDQYGRILNLRDLQEGIKRLNQRYRDQGYVLAQVVRAPQVSDDGVVTLSVAEGVVENIRIRFRTKDGETEDDKNQPIRGRTQPYIVTRELELKPGQVFNRNTVQRDLQRVAGLGLFEDLDISLDPGSDPSKVNVVVNVVERSSGSVTATGGISSANGFFAGVGFQQQNLNGRNQKLSVDVQAGFGGQQQLLFDARFTDPWIAGDPFRTSYTVNAFRRRSVSLIFDGGENDIDLPNGDRPRILRTGGGITFTRPLSRNVFRPAEWTALAGLQYQRVSIRDADGDISPRDELGNRLSFSDEGEDDLFNLQFGAIRDKRNNFLQPTSGSFLRLGVDQSIPIGLGNIFLTKLQGTYSQYIPVQWTNFTKGPQTLAFTVRGGTALGDLPPYEAFSLGGSNSVRGYGEGELGSGRSFVQATAEYRFPVFSVVSGVLFFDVGSDLGSGKDVPGDPAGVRGKPGSGYGYGIGVRIQSPLGPLRLDYGINDEGGNEFHFGFGERF